MATEVARFERKHTFTTIGRTRETFSFRKISFFLAPACQALVGRRRLEVRDLGSRNGTGFFSKDPIA